MSAMNRREFLKSGFAATSLLAAGGSFPSLFRGSGLRETGTKLLVIGYDGPARRGPVKGVKEGAKKALKIGNLVLPVSSGEVKNLQQGPTFWQILEEHDIPATVFKIPSNYPPV